jgi:hypothetical protein
MLVRDLPLISKPKESYYRSGRSLIWLSGGSAHSITSSARMRMNGGISTSKASGVQIDHELVLRCLLDGKHARRAVRHLAFSTVAVSQTPIPGDLPFFASALGL